MTPFFKYQGTGNDFVMIDNRDGHFLATTERVAAWCDRRFGIGADGLICLERAEGYDFKMVYFNADGRESTMCGNGGRCLVAFAARLGVITHEAHFVAIDGPHRATYDADTGWVSLQMNASDRIEAHGADCVLDTGSPHYVQFVPDVEAVDVYAAGRAIRYSEAFAANGVNVNFVQALPVGIAVATYERGVEAETYSCGTGVTAAVLAYLSRQSEPQTAEWQHSPKGGSIDLAATRTIPVRTRGGALSVTVKPTADGTHEVWLNGPAALVFEGKIR